MSFITGFAAGLIIGGAVIRIAYARHIALANEVISENMAVVWSDRNNVDVKF